MSERASQQEPPREGRIARSWRLSLIAWRLVRSDPAIVFLALISTLLTGAALISVYSGIGVFASHGHAHTARLALATLILAYPLTFVSVFFNTAIAAAASARMEGSRLGFGGALAVPARRLRQVALWSLLSSVVGIVVEQIARRLPLAGSVAARLFGLTWSLASMFVVPILALEGCTAPACLSRSARLVKERWGEGISGNVIITAWMGVAIVPLAIGLGIGLGATRGEAGPRDTVIAVAIIVFALIVAIAAVVRETFAVALYRYATTGSDGGGFSAADLQAPFGRGLGDRRSRGAGLRGRLNFGSLRIWLVSLALGSAVVAVWELNKHHWAARHISGRVFAAVLVCAFATLAVRLLIAGVERLVRLARSRRRNVALVARRTGLTRAAAPNVARPTKA